MFVWQKQWYSVELLWRLEAAEECEQLRSKQADLMQALSKAKHDADEERALREVLEVEGRRMRERYEETQVLYTDALHSAKEVELLRAGHAQMVIALEDARKELAEQAVEKEDLQARCTEIEGLYADTLCELQQEFEARDLERTEEHGVSEQQLLAARQEAEETKALLKATQVKLRIALQRQEELCKEVTVQAERNQFLGEEVEKLRQQCRRFRNEQFVDDRIHALEREKGRLEREVQASHASLKGVAKERSQALELLEKERMAAADARRNADRFEEEARLLRGRVRHLASFEVSSGNLSIQSADLESNPKNKRHRYPVSVTPNRSSPGTPRQNVRGSCPSSKGPGVARSRPPSCPPRPDSQQQPSAANGTLRVAELLAVAATLSQENEGMMDTD